MLTIMGAIALVTVHRAMFTLAVIMQNQKSVPTVSVNIMGKNARDDHLSQTYEQLCNNSNFVALTTGFRPVSPIF